MIVEREPESGHVVKEDQSGRNLAEAMLTPSIRHPWPSKAATSCIVEV